MMKCKKRKSEKLSIFTVMGVLFLIYVIVLITVKILYAFGVDAGMNWLMKPTFWQASLVVMLFLQYEILPFQIKNKVMQKLCLFAVATAMACLFIFGDMKYMLLWLLLVGYCLITASGHGIDSKQIVLTFLLASIEIEICSVVVLLNKNILHGVNDFIGSVWPDILFLCASIIYAYVEDDKVQLKLKSVTKRKLEKYSVRLVRGLGGILGILAIGFFSFFAVSIAAGGNKIENSGERIYLLHHYKDSSLVLTLTEEDGQLVIAFEEENGGNNQKLQFIEVGDGVYEIAFIEPRYVLGIYSLENSKDYILNMNSASMMVFAPEICVTAEGEGCSNFLVERSTGDEFVTRLLVEYKDVFTPTTLLETIMGYLGSWSLCVYIMLGVVVAGILWANKWIEKETVLFCIVLLLFMLAYASLIAIALYGFILLLLLWSGYRKNVRKV